MSTLRQVKPSIVHIASAYGLSFIKHSVLILIAKLFGCKVILAPHCSLSVFVPKSRLPYRWMQFVLNRCNGMIVLSSEWLAIHQIAPRPRVKLLKNSINLTRYVEMERSPNKTDPEVKIIFLGHIGVEKGVHDLIQAVHLLAKTGEKRFKVYIYGEDLLPGEVDKAKALARSLTVDDFIVFCEPVFGEKKLEVIREADIFTLPSHHEGLPISIIEAMAAGLPVIATCVGGIPDLIEDQKSGLLVEAKSPLPLADAIAALIGNQLLRYTYGMAGRKKAVENFDVEKYVVHLVDFYQEISES